MKFLQLESDERVSSYSETLSLSVINDWDGLDYYIKSQKYIYLVETYLRTRFPFCSEQSAARRIIKA